MPQQHSLSSSQRIVTDALAIAFQEIQTIVSSSEFSDINREKISQKLTEIEVVFIFLQQQSLAGLVATAREVSASFKVKNDLISLSIDSFFSKLIPFLADVNSGKKVLACQLLPLWHQLVKPLPENFLTPANLISLDEVRLNTLEGESNYIGVVNQKDLIPATKIEQALLELLQAEASSEKYQSARATIVNAISDICLTHSSLRQRRFWKSARLFIEMIGQGNNVDFAGSKKLISSVVRHLRQRSENVWPVLPDRLVKEMLYQLSQAKANFNTQVLEDEFRLYTQLEEASESWEVLLEPSDLISLIVKIDTLLSNISSAEKNQIHSELTGISFLLEKIPKLYETAALFNALVTTYLFEDDLKLVMCLISLKEGMKAGLKSRHIECIAQRIIVVFKEIQSLSSSGNLSTNADSEMTSRATFSWVWPEAVAALKSTMLSSLSDIEPQLDTALAAKDWVAVVDSIRNVLQPIKAIFLFLNDAEGVSRVDLLVQFGNDLEDGQTVYDFLDTSAFTQRWVNLGAYIDFTFTELDARFDRPIYLQELTETTDIHLPFDASSDVELQKIFVSEAFDRLLLLREQFEQFSQGKVNILAAHTALEAHALAGSSATAGNHSMHQNALALEQLIEQIITLSADQQRAYLPELLENLSILEKELDSSYGEQTLPINPISNVIAPLLPVNDCKDVESSNEFFDEFIPSQSNEEIVNVASSETFILQSDIEYSEASVTETPELPAKLLHEELSTSVDPELHVIFIEEASELLPQLRSELNQWVANPTESSHPTSLLRLLHTLKGSSRMAGELALGEAFHELEHRISQLSLQRSDESSELALLQKEICQLLIDAGLIEEEPSVEAERSVAIESTGELVGSNHFVIKRPTAHTKLRVDVIERASGSVAELLVNAMRSNEDCRRQKQLVIDLADNLSRLRSQLRELELQSEASISAQSAPRALGFDPLEFDRFTRLQELTRMTAESMADLSDLQRSLARQVDASLTLLATQTRHARSLQSDLYRASTQVFASIENRFRQLVRQVAKEVGREVKFELEGGAFEIDRAHLENLNGPLSHLLRNAIVHGIETMDEREQFGKPRRGLVCLKLSDHGHELRLQVTDDGRGLDYERIRERAIAEGLISVSNHVDTESLTQWIFEPGFSTAEQVTGLAGRGIGMDAVKAAVVAMGGALKVDSQSGLGTSIIIALPKASSTQKILLVSDGLQQIALPSAMVQQILHITSNNLEEAMTEGSIQWQDKKIILCSLSDLFRDSLHKQNLAAHNTIVILRQLDQWLAVWVHEILGHHEVIVKQPGVQLIGVPGLVGAAILPDGGVLLVMNLLQRELKLRSSALSTKALETPKSMVIPPLVLVVDDSLTVRRISQRMLEKNGYAVIVARHGAEALEIVRDQTPVAFLLDIEMPTMDGFELLSRLRADDRFSAVPIAMITSRIAERHRHHALQLGANAYFGKPYREQELLEWLAQSLTTYNSNTECNPIEQGHAIQATI